MFYDFQVATGCFSCSLPDLNSSRLNSIAVKVTKFFFQIIQFNIDSENQNFAAPVSSHYFQTLHFHTTLIRRTGRWNLETFEQSDALSPLTIKCLLLFRWLSPSPALLLCFLISLVLNHICVYIYLLGAPLSCDQMITSNIAKIKIIGFKNFF
jgi:hypothetical protein